VSFCSSRAECNAFTSGLPLVAVQILPNSMPQPFLTSHSAFSVHLLVLSRHIPVRGNFAKPCISVVSG